jgi:hypothetical protein
LHAEARDLLERAVDLDPLSSDGACAARQVGFDPVLARPASWICWRYIATCSLIPSLGAFTRSCLVRKYLSVV